ncbi:Add37p Ecym_2152 [Eremothecium cymbalariae DBVPG|uniref:Uncharacterized protein n=1 Tax=Eremothecium cymbalariae (strain CBS 270.75 / DBVPG 7215 / KCTC 17166 / NRRL Y-17582) TaxID=931890 RepID=G8JNI8_ERECY|nr:Hypothetical protein Ecym_2152 [Eremothecium cymbalariae DBVPG\
MSYRIESEFKSFQNCTEADVPGYNDCPSFLFSTNIGSVRKKGSAQTDGVVDRYGNTKSDTAVLPSKRKKTIAKPRASILDEGDRVEAESREVLMGRIGKLLEEKTEMSDNEFQFYKTKVLQHLPTTLENESSLTLMTLFFQHLHTDVEKAKLLLMQWMVSDVSIARWCPALRKILENATF